MQVILIKVTGLYFSSLYGTDILPIIYAGVHGCYMSNFW